MHRLRASLRSGEVVADLEVRKDESLEAEMVRLRAAAELVAMDRDDIAAGAELTVSDEAGALVLDECGEQYCIKIEGWHVVPAESCEPIDIARWNAWPRGRAVLEPGWWADDGHWPADFPGAADADEAAEAYIGDGDWGVADETVHLEVWTWREGWALTEDGELERVEWGRESALRRLDPPEPECIDGQSHSWDCPYEVLGGCREAPGVWGNGGGVVTTEVCARCGAYRIVDTWARGPSGQEGLTSTRYAQPDDASLAWVRGDDD